MKEALQTAINDLPPLPKTALELREYVDTAKDIKISEVEKIIKSDSLVFMELLKLVNSAYYSFANTINSVSHAISLLGVINVKNIILINALRSSFKVDTRPYGLDIENFTQTNHQILEFTLSFAKSMDKRLISELTPNALLLRIGIVVFSDILLKARLGNQFLQAIKEGEFRNISEVEKEFFGISSNDFLVYILQEWKFEPKIINIAKFVKYPLNAPKDIEHLVFSLSAVDSLYTLHYELDIPSILSALDCLELANQRQVNVDKNLFLDNLPQSAKNKYYQYLKEK